MDSSLWLINNKYNIQNVEYNILFWILWTFMWPDSNLLTNLSEMLFGLLGVSLWS